MGRASSDTALQLEATLTVSRVMHAHATAAAFGLACHTALTWEQLTNAKCMGRAAAGWIIQDSSPTTPQWQQTPDPRPANRLCFQFHVEENTTVPVGGRVTYREKRIRLTLKPLRDTKFKRQ